MPESAFVPVEPPAMEFVDVNLQRLEDRRRQQAQVRARLAEDRPVLATLRQRNDAAAIVAANELAPLIVTDEGLLADVDTQVATLERAVEKNRTTAASLTALVADSHQQFGPIVERLGVTNEELVAAWKMSRAISFEARGLLDSTSDRRFRRPPADPFADIKSALEDVLTRLDRIRTTHGAHLQLGRKDGTA